MYLKSIELNGFKSFPTKTRLDFEPGISCIVGPNGSGKSNLIDALRWVLGETSARSIRGGKMEDVIFSGSSKRRPLGMAEVSLILDNSDGYLPLDFSEISVTRRVTRNGGSEYFINNKACRLKELRELFVDTGIGVDGLSVITQGRVNELISARPEERRALVEEAAGIIKYRDRKLEAGRRLAETEHHLERLGDIINELSSRVEPLRLQAEKAEKFHTLREEEDQLEIGVSVKILSEANDKITALTAQIDEKKQAVVADESQRLSLAAEAEELRLSIAGLDEQVSQANERYYHLQTMREKAEGDRRLAEVSLANSEESCTRLQRELTQLEAQMHSRQEEYEQLSAHISRTEQEMAEQERLVLSGEGGDADLSERTAALSELLSRLNRENSSLSSELASATSKYEFRQEQLTKNKENLVRLNGESERLSAALTEATDAVASLDKEIDGLEQGHSEKAAALQENERELKRLIQHTQELAARQADAHFRVHSAATRLNMLNEMAAGYEGFFPGVKALMAANRKGKAPSGLIGVVAELIKVPPVYRVALEAHLGSNLQNIVCENAAAARAAVDYLKRNKLGRATFLPLDILKVRVPADLSPALGLPGVHGRASELVEVDSRLRPAVDFLLNSVLVVENMESALAAAKALKYRVSVVTLEGDHVNPGASISGGSRGGKSSELLSQKSKIDDAQQKLSVAKEDEQAADQQLNQAREQAQQVNKKNDNLSTAVRDLNVRLSDSIQQKEQLLFRRQTMLERYEELLVDIENLHQEIRLLNTEVGSAEGIVASLQQQQQALTEQIATVKADLTQAEDALSRSRQDVAESRVALAASKQKLRGQKISLEKLQTDLTDLGWEAEERSTDLQAAQQQASTAGQAIEAADEQLKELGLRLADAEQQLEQARHGLAAESAWLNELDKADREHLRHQDKIKNELHQLEIRRERWQADFENESVKLAEKFSLDLATARQRVGDTPARTVMLSRLTQLRREIAALGNVNIDAIEEYQEVSTRYTFLSGQREDMLAAKQQLNDVIREMNSVMASRFRTTFAQLSEAFHNSFVRLFGGGKAQLLLSDAEDILETGVEISVSLPGKKVSNYNLLSGGEKSLVGIALMFAMLTVRTTPFCVLDEVDAALDEANIDRYTAFLTDRASSNQFIMISHRQSTMEAASSLWGVTMSEEGVSRVISVRLTESGYEAE